MSTDLSRWDHDRPHTLRLFAGDEPLGPANDGGDISPRMSLTQFFDRWYVQIICASERENRESTIKKYRDALVYWVRITGDPPLAQIDEFTAATFAGGMRTGSPQAYYQRGGPLSPKHPLAAITAAGHVGLINRLLEAAGPRVDRRKTAKGLIAEPPLMRVKKPKTKVKPPFPLDVARSLVATATKLPRTRKLSAELHRLWWLAVLPTWYFTGLRRGTVAQLTWEMVERRGDEQWLVIPGKIVDKTNKPLEKLWHPEAAAAATKLRDALGVEQGGKLFPWPHHPRHVWDRHDTLQRLAGVAKRMGPHAWRRTHATQMGLLGARYGLKVAQLALDHADDRTTSNFYLDLEPTLIAQLPSLEPPAMDAQRWLF